MVTVALETFKGPQHLLINTCNSKKILSGNQLGKKKKRREKQFAQSEAKGLAPISYALLYYMLQPIGIEELCLRQFLSSLSDLPLFEGGK